MSCSAKEAPKPHQLPRHQADDVDQVLPGAAPAADDLLLGLEQRDRGHLEGFVEIGDDQELAARPQHGKALEHAFPGADVVSHHVDALAVGEVGDDVLSDSRAVLTPTRAVPFGQRQPLRLGRSVRYLGAGDFGDLHAVDAQAADPQDEDAWPMPTPPWWIWLWYMQARRPEDGRASYELPARHRHQVGRRTATTS